MTYYASLHCAQSLHGASEFLYDEAVVANGIPRNQLFILQSARYTFRVIRKITPETIRKAPYSQKSKMAWVQGHEKTGGGGLIESTERVREWLDKYEPMGVV